MLKQRVLTAVFGIPALIATFLYGPSWVISILFLGGVSLSAYEISGILLPALAGSYSPADNAAFGVQKSFAALRVIALLIALSTFLGAIGENTETVRGFLAGGVFVAFLVGAISGLWGATVDIALGRGIYLMFTVTYGVLPWVILFELNRMGDQGKYIFFTLTVVWAGDTGAYFGGRYLGKTPLAPKISPKKTREGAIVGLLASGLGAWIVNRIYGGHMGPEILMIVIGICAGVFGQLGDLFESTLKRFGGAKDSGALFPGHGGLLDRLDGVFFAAPVIWIMLYIFGGV